MEFSLNFLEEPFSKYRTNLITNIASVEFYVGFTINAEKKLCWHFRVSSEN